MYLYSFQVVLQEVPGEVSLCFSISGCTLKCKGCHSPFLWKAGSGTLLTEVLYKKKLNQYKNLASCVLFMGGEWHKKELINFLKLAKNKNYKTCLYTGETDISEDIKDQLTWLKTGKWVEELGGLDRKSTNQNYIETKSNTNLNHLFFKQ